jgi:hypothetical protein
MLSRASTRAPQAKQCEGGVTTDMPRGMRAMHTLRKLPQMAPKAAAATSAGILQAARYSPRDGFTSRRYHLVVDFAASRCGPPVLSRSGGGSRRRGGWLWPQEDSGHAQWARNPGRRPGAGWNSRRPCARPAAATCTPRTCSTSTGRQGRPRRREQAGVAVRRHHHDRPVDGQAGQLSPGGKQRSGRRPRDRARGQRSGGGLALRQDDPANRAGFRERALRRRGPGRALGRLGNRAPPGRGG